MAQVLPGAPGGTGRERLAFASADSEFAGTHALANGDTLCSGASDAGA